MAMQKKKTRKRTPRQVAFTRFMIVIAVFVLWIGGISVRLVHLQVNQHEWLSKKAREQRTDVKRARLPRGTIYDRNERILAMSNKVKTLYANPMEIEDLPAAAKSVSKALGVNQNQVLKQLKDAREDERKFVPLAKGLEGPAVENINKALETPDIRKSGAPKYPGLYWREEQVRMYPQQSMAA